jgi:hypothetical protein
MNKILLILLISVLLCSCSKTKEAKVCGLSVKAQDSHLVYMIITDNGKFEDRNIDAFMYENGQFNIGSCYIIKYKNELSVKKTPIVLNAIKINC